TTPNGNAYDVEVKINYNNWPQSTVHIRDAQSAGQSEVLTIQRSGASANRQAWQGLRDPNGDKTYPTVSGQDRDEYPPAMFKQGGSNASIRYMSPSDNRGSGSYFGNFLRGNGSTATQYWPDGTRVWFNPTNIPNGS